MKDGKVPQIKDKPVRDPSEPKSILDEFGAELQGMTSGHVLIDEIQLYSQFYTNNLIEKSDKKEIQKLGKTSFKYFFVGLLVGGVGNRLLTKAKFGSFDFLRWHWLIRLPIRFLILSSSFYIFFLVPSLNQAFDLRDRLNSKYSPRLRKYLNTQDPTVMNTVMLSECETDEEREYVKHMLMASQMQTDDKRAGKPKV
jgi:hypothetical protein